jgi:PAS domain S-box-containing protein
MNYHSRTKAYCMIALAFLACVLVRFLLDPWLDENLRLTTLFGAVAIATWIGGYRPAIVVTIVGYVIFNWLFLEPRYAFVLTPERDFAGVFACLFSSAIIIGLGHAMRSARRRAECTSLQLQLDIDERKKAEAALTKAHQQYDLIFKTVREGFAHYRTIYNEAGLLHDLLVVHVNPAGSALAGMTPEDQIGKTWRQLWPEMVDEGLLSKYEQADRSGEAVMVEYEDQVSDRAFEIAITRIAPGEVIASFHDVTERNRKVRAIAASEERYRSLATVTADVLLSWGATGAFVAPHGAWEAYTGQTWEEHRGYGWAKAIHPDDRERIMKTWLAACETGTRYEAQARLRHAPSGQWRHCDGRAAPLFNADGTVREWVGAVTDVEETVKITAALRESDRRKDEFLAMLAHELRNPLAPIGYATQILAKKELSAADLQWVREVLVRQVNQMGRLLDDLLDVSRITRGMIELRRTRVELGDVLNDAIVASRPFIEKSGHTLSVDMPSGSIILDADPTRLAQVLVNLLNNAAKYTERGGVIALRAELDHDQAVVRISDNGIGIPPEMLSRIFEMFAQEDRSIERSRGGLGIGLNLAQRLVAMHGGSLRAHSNGPGHGSEFVVRLPVMRDAITDAALTSPPRDSIIALPLRVLIVDDNRDAVDGMAMVLERGGHTVRCAHDGLAAVEEAAMFKPDVIVLDIGLPKLNGYDAARRIRAQGGNVLLIALTGWGQKEDRERSREAGFDHHLTKPVVFEELNKLLGSVDRRGRDQGPDAVSVTVSDRAI